MNTQWGCQDVYMGRFPEFWVRAASVPPLSTRTLCQCNIRICALYVNSMQKNAAHMLMRLGHTDFVEKCQTNVEKPYVFG